MCQHVQQPNHMLLGVPMVACVLIPLARCITQRKSPPPRLDARLPTSVHVPMPAPTTLSELIALYLARCRIEGLSPRTQRAVSDLRARRPLGATRRRRWWSMLQPVR